LWRRAAAPSMAPVATGDEEVYGAYGTPTLSMPAFGGSTLSGNLAQYGGSAASEPFVVREQAEDGNCLFRSFSDQLYGTPEHHALVRDRCSKYIASERDYFEQFVTEPFEQFLARIQREGEWGDDVEIEAVSEIYDCRVEIYAPYNQALMRTFHEACDATWPRPIRLQYTGHSHYDSLVPAGAHIPITKSMPGHQAVLPGEIEDAAILRSRRRREAGKARKGAGDFDREQTDREVVDESIRLSRAEFEHRSEEEMDRTLKESQVEWEKAEGKRIEEEVMGAMLQQSVLEEEQKQLQQAMEQSRSSVVRGELAAPCGIFGAAEAGSAVKAVSGASSSSASEQDRDAREFQYPESVYAVMSMGFPLEKCIQAYHLVGDNPEGILAFCCQALGL